MKILLVDDDLDFMRSANRALKAADHLGIMRLGATAALFTLDRRGREFDLIVIDYYMPGGMNGIELAKEIRESGFLKPIIIWTAGEPRDLEVAAKKVGVNDVLLKRPSSLLEFIERLSQ